MKKIISLAGIFSLFVLQSNAQNGHTEITPENIVISPSQTLSVKDTLLRRSVSEWSEKQLRSTDYKKIKAHPSASFFPGAIKEGYQFINRTVHIQHKKISDTLVPIVSRLNYSSPWAPVMYSTGLYAAPGEYIEVETKRKGISVQIGAHSDPLNYWVAAKEDWRRMPILVKHQDIEKETPRMASPFGGLIYITAPADEDSWEDDVIIRHAIAAPLFVLGKTKPEEWKEQQANNKAPWGELAANDIILTIPDSILQKVDDPVYTMKLWDMIIGGEMELAQIPQPFYRKTRLVIDEHIGGGFMHSGYPIMVHHSPTRKMLSADVIADPKLLMQPSKGGANWGFFHEIGHNLQNLDWVFGGTTEVSCNFFSLYMFDRMLGGRDQAHDGIANANTQQAMKKYFQEGASYDKWKKDPFLGLIMFRQLQEGFGWESFKTLFRQYQRIAAEYDRDNKNKQVAEQKLARGNRRRSREELSDEEKIDRWVKTFSEIVGRNLAPFFESWGIPVSASIKKQLNGLATWMPYNFPPAN